jgi:hypothetical protein
MLPFFLAVRRYRKTFAQRNDVRTIVQIAVQGASVALQIRITDTMPKFTGPLLAISAIVVFASVGLAQAADDQVDPVHKNPLRVRDMANRPCVSIKGRTMHDKVNTTIMTHYLNAANSCSNVIKIKACYTESTRCVEFTLHSMEHKEVLFGITNTSMPILNFDFTEKQL